MNLEKEHDSGNLYDDLFLFDGEINRFLPSFIFWAHGKGTFYPKSSGGKIET
jgi:hypothetical protein